MEKALRNTGKILVTSINKVSTSRVIIQDIDYLETMLEGALSAPEVVYAIVRDREGQILVTQSKGILRDVSRAMRDPERSLLPDDALTDTFFAQQHHTPYTQPLISIWDTVPKKMGKLAPRTNGASAAEMRKKHPETLYDFAFSPRRVKARDF